VLGTEIGHSGFRFTGEPTGRPPLPEETVGALRRAGSRVEQAARTWTDEHREQARQLRAQGMSYAQIAEAVCGDRRCRQTVAAWTRQAAVAGNGDGSG
jgi:hypothetical protein